MKKSLKNPFLHDDTLKTRKTQRFRVVHSISVTNPILIYRSKSLCRFQEEQESLQRTKRSTSSFYSCSSNRSSDRPPMIRECSNTIISSILSTRRRSRPRVLAVITIHRCADLCTLISTITRTL